LNLRLAERSLALKITLNQFGAYLSDDWRRGLNRQLDFMLDCEEWPADALLPSPDSFAALLRLIIYLKPIKRPSLGVADDGRLVAAWDSEGAHLVVQCNAGESVRWSSVHMVDGQREVSAGQTTIPRLIANLSAFEPSRWFDLHD
jgi:hypothetical protein